jgi:hypothetical protein
MNRFFASWRRVLPDSCRLIPAPGCPATRLSVPFTYQVYRYDSDS